MADRTSVAGRTAAESRETRTAARSAAGRQSRAARPEQVVVADPPPEPDYPRYRVEPGAGVRLADVDPEQTVHRWLPSSGRGAVAPTRTDSAQRPGRRPGWETAAPGAAPSLGEGRHATVRSTPARERSRVVSAAGGWRPAAAG